jgi:hypothetical protein
MIVDGWVGLVMVDRSCVCVLWIIGTCSVGSVGNLLDLAMNVHISLIVSPLGSRPFQGRHYF